MVEIRMSAKIHFIVKLNLLN